MKDFNLNQDSFGVYLCLQICPLTMQNLVLGCLVDLCENVKVTDSLVWSIE